ncbi:xyloside xylosyltransferase 1 [Brachionus plicatilis]|uniref:Xyloside xylosyltransferase 1 n=1 Tax=Brachionus plicatilis TaxID=10195 RepID=A0A3M7SMW0_BRAPC|nr:xyloside xylosyltransferase 1 [Brachionus plicatilis]
MKIKFFIFIFLVRQILASGPIDVGIIFTKAGGNENLIEKFKTCVSSILKYSSIDLNLYIIGDTESQYIAKNVIDKIKKPNINFNLKSIDADSLAKKMHELVSKMQNHFSHSPTSYYGDSLFFLSIGLHKVFNQNIDKMILLDSDLKFKRDIGDLHALFSNFSSTNLIGIARDGQPVYRHLFWQFRKENLDTRVGNPPPDGLTGFNSGVLLLDLAKMRRSQLYNQLLTNEKVDYLTKKYYFKGHLGDQDFFSLVGMEHEELFYVLPCQWNRQLCRWWGEHGYGDVIDEYYKCDGEIFVYHGNCNTPLPRDSDDDEYQSYFVRIKNDL